MTDEQQTPDSTGTPSKPQRARRAASSKKITPPQDGVGTEKTAAPDTTPQTTTEAPAKPRRTRRKTTPPAVPTEAVAAAPASADIPPGDAKGEGAAAVAASPAPKTPAKRTRKTAAPKNTDASKNTDSPAPKRPRKPAARKAASPKGAKPEIPLTDVAMAEAAPAATTPDVTAHAAMAENTMSAAQERAVPEPSPSDADLAVVEKTTPAADTSAQAEISLAAPALSAPDVPLAQEAFPTATWEASPSPEAIPPSMEAHADLDNPAESSLDDAAHTALPSEADADTDAEADAAQGEARKSRRGRRGGRGRGRKKNAAETITDAPQSSAAEEDEEIELPAPQEVKAAPDVRKSTGKAEDTPVKSSRRKMFISVVPGEQVEVALVEEGAIHEYYLEMSHQAKTKGNIYKGVIHNVDTNLQAAFVSYGTGKNGFLQIDEIHPEYYLTHHDAVKGKKFPPIQKVIKSGQEVLVQVVKEPTGNKGAFLTTWISLAGRFLVLTPGQEQIGVSRKVDNDEERARLREMMNGIDPGEGLGVIVRTVSAGTSKTTLKNDLQYLKRVWKEIRKRATSEPSPSLVYKESGLAERAVRDYLTEDVCEVWVDNESVAESLRETVSLLFPRKEDLVRVHADVRQTLWERFNIQRQLEQIYSREVTLPSGGRLVFDQTEALMAIDINSGKISGKGNFESMALKTNLEAAEAIARHLKLRDIGGQVVIDFIEMRDKNHIRDVEKTLRNAMKNDRARHDIGRMSSFGLLEIVRQRTGSSALAITMEPCPACGGTGLRRNLEWQSLQALREIGRQARNSSTGKCIFEATPELGMYLLNHKRDRLREMEQQQNTPIEIRIRP